MAEELNIDKNASRAEKYKSLVPQIQALIEADKTVASKIRFFLGYSGWGEKQLTDELKENAWIVADNISTDEILSTSDDQFWNHCLEKQGERFKTISKFPINPQDN